MKDPNEHGLDKKLDDKWLFELWFLGKLKKGFEVVRNAGETTASVEHQRKTLSKEDLRILLATLCQREDARKSKGESHLDPRLVANYSERVKARRATVAKQSKAFMVFVEPVELPKDCGDEMDSFLDGLIARWYRANSIKD